MGRKPIGDAPMTAAERQRRRRARMRPWAVSIRPWDGTDATSFVEALTIARIETFVRGGDASRLEAWLSELLDTREYLQAARDRLDELEAERRAKLAARDARSVTPESRNDGHDVAMQGLRDEVKDLRGKLKSCRAASEAMKQRLAEMRAKPPSEKSAKAYRDEIKRLKGENRALKVAVMEQHGGTEGERQAAAMARARLQG